MDAKRHIISILLQNEAGALARVASMYSSRGYNIESLTVAPTHDASMSRITLVTSGSDAVITQIVKQSRKIVDVVEISDLTMRNHIEYEMALVKLDINASTSKAVLDCLSRYRATVLDESQGSRTAYLAASGLDINDFIAELSELSTLTEVVRSGVAAIEPGNSIFSEHSI